MALAAALIARELVWRSEHARLRERLADRAAELREHEHRAQVAQVIAGLAQELKSPLQGVLGNAELLLASGSLAPAPAASVSEIQQYAARAAGIVRNLLVFTETHALTRRWHDINNLVSRAADSVRGEHGAGPPVTLTLGERLPLVYVDGRQLEKVVATLLSRPWFDGAAPVPVMLSTRLSAPGDRVIIELDDRTADVDEPAWSGDLAACREVVQAHGGTLEVAPDGQARYRFQLELPAAAAGAAPAGT